MGWGGKAGGTRRITHTQGSLMAPPVRSGCCQEGKPLCVSVGSVPKDSSYLYGGWKPKGQCVFGRSSISDSFVTPWTVAHQTALSMGFSRQEYWHGLPFPSPGDLPDPESETLSPALAGGFFTGEAQRGTEASTRSHRKSSEELGWPVYRLGTLPNFLTPEAAQTPPETHLIVFVDLDASLGWEPLSSQGNPVQFSCRVGNGGLSISRPPSQRLDTPWALAGPWPGLPGELER